MLNIIRWAAGIILAAIALMAFILFSASVIAVMEQATLGATAVGIAIALVLFIIVTGSSLGAWLLITAALRW